MRERSGSLERKMHEDLLNARIMYIRNEVFDLVHEFGWHLRYPGVAGARLIVLAHNSDLQLHHLSSISEIGRWNSTLIF